MSEVLESWATAIQLLEKSIVMDYISWKLLFPSPWKADLALRKAKELGIVRVREYPTPEFEKCMEQAKKNKRIKYPRKFCMRKAPLRIVIELDVEVLDGYKERWGKAQTQLPFLHWLFAITPAE